MAWSNSREPRHWPDEQGSDERKCVELWNDFRQHLLKPELVLCVDRPVFGLLTAFGHFRICGEEEEGPYQSQAAEDQE